MATYVLVHGAWHGGWCWRELRPLLEQARHEVFTPSLTGLGDRAHLSRPEIDLALHVQDIVGVLETEDLRDVILLGHSYGGMVVTGAAARAAARIRRLVYLDAFVPEAGRCALDYVVPERAAAFREQGEKSGFVAPPPLSLWGLVDPEHIAFAKPRERPHPYATFAQPVHVEDPAALARLPKTFIYCSSPATGTFDAFAAKYRAAPGWRFHELKTGHDAMILVPRQLAAILLREAE